VANQAEACSLLSSRSFKLSRTHKPNLQSATKCESNSLQTAEGKTLVIWPLEARYVLLPHASTFGKLTLRDAKLVSQARDLNTQTQRLSLAEE
jgi:hypothetical protein